MATCPSGSRFRVLQGAPTMVGRGIRQNQRRFSKQAALCCGDHIAVFAEDLRIGGLLTADASQSGLKACRWAESRLWIREQPLQLSHTVELLGTHLPHEVFWACRARRALRPRAGSCESALTCAVQCAASRLDTPRALDFKNRRTCTGHAIPPRKPKGAIDEHVPSRRRLDHRQRG